MDTGHPAIRETLRGIGRRHGAPQRRAAALTTAEFRKLLAACRDDLAGLRDRALLLLGYAAALRRSELAAVEHEHLQFTADGLELLLPGSKGDAAGKGARVGVPRGQRPETCPVRAVEAWLRASAIRYGPVFCRVTRWGADARRARTCCLIVTLPGRMLDRCSRALDAWTACAGDRRYPASSPLLPGGLPERLLRHMLCVVSAYSEIPQLTVRHRPQLVGLGHAATP
jgi:integrase